MLASEGGGVGVGQQVVCIHCDCRSLHHIPVPLRAVPGPRVPEVKVTKREVIH